MRADDLPPAFQRAIEHATSLDFDRLVENGEAKVAAARTGLIDMFAPFDAFDILANIAAANLPASSEDYAESLHAGLIVLVEYAVALLLERGRAGLAEDKPPIDAVILDAVDELLRDATDGIVEIYLGRLKDEIRDTEEAVSEAMNSLRFGMATSELFMRNPAYPHQEEATLRGVFGDPGVANSLRAIVGFDVEDALALTHAIIEVVADKQLAARVKLRADIEAVSDLYDRYRKDPDTPLPDHIRGLFDAMGPLSRKKALKALTSTGVIGVWASAGSMFAFSAEEVADKSGQPLEIVRLFLTAFGLSFGEVSTDDWEAAAREVRQRPILIGGDGSYLCPLPSNLIWGLRPRLSDALNPDRSPAATVKTLNALNRTRAKWLETDSVDILERLLRPNEVLRNLEYKIGNDWYEADGLLVLDTVAFVIETKAGGISPPARRAAPQRLRSDLQKLIEDGATQAQRLRTAVQTRDALTVRDPTGERELDVSGVEHVFSVVVTLEHLGSLAIHLWDLERAQILRGQTDLPWVVSHSDLEIIAQIAELPAQFVHYLLRRRAVNTMARLHTQDELDLWMYYLDSGLYDDPRFDEPDAPDRVMIGTLTDPLDAYFLHLEGGPAALQPEQEMPLAFREMLHALDTERPWGFLEVSNALLNMSARDRELTVARVAEMRASSAKENLFRDMTLLFTGSLGSDPVQYGLTIMTGPPDRGDELVGRLDTYCQAKKYQLKAPVWIGLGSHQGESAEVQYYLFGAFPWEEDQALADLVELLGLEPPPTDD